MNRFLLLGAFLILLLATVSIFIFSCVVTLSDGQGAIIFLFSLPAMLLILALSWYLAGMLEKTQGKYRLKRIPEVFLVVLVLFFITMFIPVVNRVPSAFLGLVGKSFEFVTGKSPYLYFKDRKSFPTLLEKSLMDSAKSRVDFSVLDVSFAWDRVCIFGPYTNNEKAKSILDLDWDIEARSEISHSDSINALVFLYEGKPNMVVDLKRSVADFESKDGCFQRGHASFVQERSAGGRVLKWAPLK